MAESESYKADSRTVVDCCCTIAGDYQISLCDVWNKMNCCEESICQSMGKIMMKLYGYKSSDNLLIWCYGFVQFFLCGLCALKELRQDLGMFIDLYIFGLLFVISKLFALTQII